MDSWWLVICRAYLVGEWAKRRSSVWFLLPTLFPNLGQFPYDTDERDCLISRHCKRDILQFFFYNQQKDISDEEHFPGFQWKSFKWPSIILPSFPNGFTWEWETILWFSWSHSSLFFWNANPKTRPFRRVLYFGIKCTISEDTGLKKSLPSFVLEIRSNFMTMI